MNMMPNKQNYFEDAQSPKTEAESKPAPAEDKEEEGESQTAELPKSVLGGKEFKPGEEVMLQVVQVMENSVLVKYAEEKGPEEGGEKGGEEMAAAPEGGAGGGNPGGGLYS